MAFRETAECHCDNALCGINENALAIVADNQAECNLLSESTMCTSDTFTPYCLPTTRLDHNDECVHSCMHTQ